jgi:hypothetical protein
MVYQNRNIFTLLVAVTACMVAPRLAWALSFAPSQLSTEAFPGVPISEELQLFNETTDNVRVDVQPAGMQVNDAQKGSGQLLLEEADRPLWLTVSPSSFTLAPGERKTVQVRIVLPSDVRGTLMAGVALFSSPVRSAEEGGVSIRAVTGPFIFVRPVGQADESAKAELVKLESDSSFSVRSSLPISLRATIANTGDVHIIPSGEVEVRGLFGRVLATLPLNAEGRLVLPHTVRDIPIAWGGTEVAPAWKRELAGPFGPVTVTVRLPAENGDSASVATKRFFFLPWRTGAVAGCILFGAAALWRRLRRL